MSLRWYRLRHRKKKKEDALRAMPPDFFFIAAAAKRLTRARSGHKIINWLPANHETISPHELQTIAVLRSAVTASKQSHF
jgi:hypothetical protein